VAYLDLQDFISALGEDVLIQLTDHEDLGEVNEAVVNLAIDGAAGFFNSYIRGRGYALPVPATPMVKSANLDIAIYNLYKSRTSIPEGVYVVRLDAYKQTMKLLLDISNGKASLDVETIAETIENPQMTDKILTNKDKSKFNDNTMGGY
jgi:phage gp36-like protein